jgi:FkbM family methyltransferase
MLGMWYYNDYRIGEFYRPKPGDIIFDIGAHVGLFTLRLLQEEPRCRVVAFEPSPENFACLRQNIAGCRYARQVQLHHLGIAGEFGKVRMKAIATNRSFDAQTERASDTDTEAIAVAPLSYLFELAGVERVALLKMDVEGAEHAAFSSVSASVLSRIERLVMEYHDNLVPGTLALLEERLSATHQVFVLRDAGQLHGRLFAVLKPCRQGLAAAPDRGFAHRHDPQLVAANGKGL